MPYVEDRMREIRTELESWYVLITRIDSGSMAEEGWDEIALAFLREEAVKKSTALEDEYRELRSRDASVMDMILDLSDAIADLSDIVSDLMQQQ